jgi:hypothetical protein
MGGWGEQRPFWSFMSPKRRVRAARPKPTSLLHVKHLFSLHTQVMVVTDYRRSM